MCRLCFANGVVLFVCVIECDSHTTYPKPEILAMRLLWYADPPTTEDLVRCEVVEMCKQDWKAKVSNNYMRFC